MATVHGICIDALRPVKQIFQKNLENGEEIGASLYVNLGGRTVVDIYGGFADEKRTRPWREDTLVNIWSSTKNVTSLAALLLVDRGLLELDAPVAKYWPEFAANGKAEKVLVRHLLSHSSGLSGFELPFKYEDVYDLETSTAHLAAQAPWWEPGTASGYHAITYGHLIGEIVRRLSGKPLRTFIKDEIARPLDADFQLGAQESEWHRVAEIIPPTPSPELKANFAKLDTQSVAFKTLSIAMFDTATKPNTPGFRLAEIGALNGHTNARALGRIFSPLALGGRGEGGAQSLSPQTIDKIFEVQTDGVDLVALLPLRFGLGFGLSHPGTTPWIPQGRVAFWMGWGGSIVLIDLDKKLTITYAMNKMGEEFLGSPRTQQYVGAIYEAVRALE